jgi:hypothetical protein
MGEEAGSPTVVVARAGSFAEAEFLKSVLAAHDIIAGSTAAETAYPSIDFVQGLSISVPADQAEEARAVLTGLDDAEIPGDQDPIA